MAVTQHRGCKLLSNLEEEESFPILTQFTLVFWRSIGPGERKWFHRGLVATKIETREL